jgi:hypothetical protein
VPQILRSLGILRYGDSLSVAVDSGSVIPWGSEEEVALRAATIIAVERMHVELGSSGFQLMVLELDWLLWQKGEMLKDSLKPHHKTLSIYY